MVDKPQDIQEPTLLQGQKEWEMCAFLCMNSTITSDWDIHTEAERGPESGTTVYPPIVIQSALGTAKEPASASNHIPNPGTYSISSEEDHYHRIAPGERPAIMLGYGDEIYGFRSVKRGGALCLPKQPGGLWTESPRLRRLELYSNATKSFSSEHEFLLETGAVCDSMPNWPLDEHLEECAALTLWQIAPGTKWSVRSNEDRLRSVLFGLILAGLLYGGLHLLAWKVPFASRAERILWRFSGIFIISAGVGFTGLKGYYNAGLNLFEKLRNMISWVWLVFWGPCVSTMCLGHLLSRTFLVVECFLQLFRLPASAYETLEWSVYFPHITQRFAELSGAGTPGYLKR